MRNEKSLIKLLRDLVDVLAQESDRNPEFAARVDAILNDLPSKPAKKPQRRSAVGLLPDIHAEWSLRGEIDFRLWLRDQPVQTLRMLIREHHFDQTRRSVKWKEAEKLAEFISDSLRARLARGSAFMSKTSRS